MTVGALFDVDGTLVDSNYLHAVAWWQAFRSQGHDVAMSRLHHLVGQGSERLVTSVLGRADDAVVTAHSDFFGPHRYELRAFEGAAQLLRTAAAAGCRVVLATSASDTDLDHLRKALGADDVIDCVTTKDDADDSKPDPDILQTAMDKAGLQPADCVLVGDTVWDVEAAKRAGIPCVCVLTGGIAAADLTAAGAVEVYDDVARLTTEFETSLLGKLARR